MIDYGLLQNVLENPEDDLARLLCADWFQENGEWERGKFVRAQVKLARLGPPHLVIAERCVLRNRYGPDYYTLTGGEETTTGRLIMVAKIGDRIDVMKSYSRPMYGLRFSKMDANDEMVLVNDADSKPWGG